MITYSDILKNKTALITGAAGILGKHFAAGLAQTGANLVLVDCNTSECNQLAQELKKKYSAAVISIPCDITNQEAVIAMVEQAVDRFDSIDILHNNAATKSQDLSRYFDPFESYSLETWREVTAVNLDATFLVAQAVGKKMIAAGQGGSIIQTASIYGVVAPDQRIYQGSEYLGREINTPAVYSASKAAVIGLTKYLASYWAQYNIRVNAITPGGVESGQNDCFKQKYSARVPLSRMAQAEEIVNTLIFLASDASSYITGQNIIVDGGLSVW